MPTFQGKTFASYFRNILGMNQSSNTGVDTTTRNVHDGAGQSTSISLSDDVLSVQPVTDNTTGTMLVKNQGGSNILAVDTTNSKVLTGASQVAANTQYTHFGIHSLSTVWSSGAADQHYAVPFQANSNANSSLLNLGSSQSSSFNDTNPASSLTISSTADDLVVMLWHIIDNITIDAVHWFVSDDASSGSDVAAHLMSYAIDKGGSSTSGDLSGGVVVADGANLTMAGYEQLYYQSMTIQSADVDAGKVILFVFTMDQALDTSINATVKYHIR